MIVDASALLAILLREPDAVRYAQAISQATVARMASVNWLEVAMIVDRRGDDVALAGFEEMVEELAIEIVPVTSDHVKRARRAWRIYGKGVHPARLNFGDCMAYSLAISERMPLLFKGDDFPQTDVEPALVS